MKEQYYGIQRSEDYLAHYGIKGMKWGVQKARASGNDFQLGKHYMKAQKKLAKLEKKANSGKMSEEGSKHFKKAGRAALDTGIAAGIGGAAGLATVGAGRLGLTALGAGAAAVGLGRAAYHLGKGIKRKVQSGYRYNRRAQQKRDQFKRAMNESFKGTKYARMKHSENKHGYYAATEIDGDVLAHYGIKGMKWGVRKAIESGNEKKLDRQYKKASVKLAKLSERSDVEVIRKKHDDGHKYAMGRAAYAGFGTTAAGTALAAARKIKLPLSTGAIAGVGAMAVYGVGHGIKQAKLSRLMSAKGHVKAVAKRDAFKNAMNESFKGTKYDQNMTNKKPKKRR